jgi:nucleoside-diphosphate-sugar epimerase
MKNKLIDFIQEDCSSAAEWSVEKLLDLRNQKILVTGGTGFFGSWIAEFICYLNDAHNFNISLQVLARNTQIIGEQASHLSKRKDIQFISTDIRNLKSIQDDVSLIIHAASSPDNRFHVSNPIETASVITDGTSNLLDLAVKLPALKKILYLSSGQVYGTGNLINEPIPENGFGFLNCNRITSVYPEAKRMAEATCCAFSNQFKIPIVIARPFSFIGPFQSLSRPWAINNFMHDALYNKTIHIVGNGEPVRSYMYPADLVVWILKILISGRINSAYNVGSPFGINLKNAAKEIIQIAQTNVDIDIKHYNNDTYSFIPDIALCENELGLKINYNIKDTLSRSITWFKMIK